MKIKKGKLNYDQSGRAYPNNRNIKENWECIWEHDGKYYQLVGDDEHKEWSEVNIYNQIIDEVYAEYCKWYGDVDEKTGNLINTNYPHSKSSKEEFIFRIKSDDEFANIFGLTIEERELSVV